MAAGPYDTPVKQAAALMEGIIRLHPFPDGNKRTALLATSLFLSVHDYRPVMRDTVRFMVEIANNGGRTEEEIADLREHVASWLEERTATTYAGFIKLWFKRLVSPP